ncbi:MAG: prolyl oligopeptidase family serine peptidase [Pseudomonadota bacterium]
MKRRHLLMFVPAVALLLMVFRPWRQSAESIENQIASLRERAGALEKKKPAGVTDGSIATVIWHLDEAGKYWKNEKGYADRSIGKAKKYLDLADKGKDPLEEERGMTARAYRSKFAPKPVAYSVWVPKNYSSDRKYGLVLNLHGGSSTHNLFLAVTLGNWAIPWATYWNVRHDVFTPQLEPGDHFVAAPDGFGQLRWRWMAEEDVMNVVRDIKLHYSIDPKRIALCGLSNGGIGAYAIGTKHASSFSSVFPMAGISDWLKFHKASSMADWSKKINAMESGISYAMNARNTYYHFIHGEKDAGPMKVIQARAMHELLDKLGIQHKYQEIPDYGHDIIWILWGKGRILEHVDKHPKNPRPDEVWLETLSYRAARQHWIEVAQMEKFLEPVRIKAKLVKEENRFDIEAENAERIIVHLFESPVDLKKKISVRINGAEADIGKVPPDGRIMLTRQKEAWAAGEAEAHEPSAQGKLRKQKGLSGPATDVNYDSQIHVYGTLVDADKAKLKQAAELGARNWMKAKQFTDVDFPVKGDGDVTQADMKSSTLVIYGTYAHNSLLQKIGDKLPIKVLSGGIELRGKLYDAPDVGAVFVYPNPLNRKKYVLVVTGNSLEAVLKGNELLPFLPDYVIFDKQVPNKALGMAASKKIPFIEAGFFTEYWKLP